MITTLKTLKESLDQLKIKEHNDLYDDVLKKFEYLKLSDKQDMNFSDLQKMIIKDLEDLSISEFLIKYKVISGLHVSNIHFNYQTKAFDKSVLKRHQENPLSRTPEYTSYDCADGLKYMFDQKGYQISRYLYQQRKPYFEFICKTFDFILEEYDLNEHYMAIGFNIPNNYSANHKKQYLCFQMFRFGWTSVDGDLESNGSVIHIPGGIHTQVIPIIFKCKFLNELASAFLVSIGDVYEKSEKTHESENDNMLEVLMNFMNIFATIINRNTTFHFSSNFCFDTETSIRKINLNKVNNCYLTASMSNVVGGNGLHSVTSNVTQTIINRNFNESTLMKEFFNSKLELKDKSDFIKNLKKFYEVYLLGVKITDIFTQAYDYGGYSKHLNISIDDFETNELINFLFNFDRKTSIPSIFGIFLICFHLEFKPEILYKRNFSNFNNIQSSFKIPKKEIQNKKFYEKIKHSNYFFIQIKNQNRA